MIQHTLTPERNVVGLQLFVSVILFSFYFLSIFFFIFSISIPSKANGVKWYGHVLKRDDGHVLRKALEFEVKGKRKRGRPKKTWKTQVEKESKSVGLEKEDAP